MTDSRAVEVIRQRLAPYAPNTETDRAVEHIAARLREPASELSSGDKRLISPVKPHAEAQADEVVCLECGQPTMHMGQVCYACSHPAAKPAEAQAQGGVEVRIPSAAEWVEQNKLEAAVSIDWRCGWDACRVEFPRTAPPSAPVGVDLPPKGWNPCSRCRVKGKSDDCERCGGSGWRKKCNALDCIEYGCNGYGFCIVTKDELAAALAQQPAAVAQPDWGSAPPGATHYQPHQGAYYKRVSASEWYVWSRMEPRELLRWLPSPGTSDSAEWIVRPAEAQQPQQPAAVDGARPVLTELVATLAATGTVTGGRIYFPERQTRELLKKACDALAAQPGGSDHAR